jgi:hypothetical protein
MEPRLGPQRTIYAVTPQGRQDVASWLDAPVHHIRDIRPHLLLKLALLDRAGADPADLVSRQRALPPRSASWTASLRSPLALGRGCYRRTGRRDRYRLPELLVPVPRVGRPALDVQRLRSAAHVALPVDLAATRGVRLEKAAQEPDDFPVAQRERSTFGHCHAPSSKQIAIAPYPRGQLAQLESLDNGKPVAVARAADVPLAVDLFHYMAGWAAKIEGNTINISVPHMPGAQFHSYTLREPVGVVGQIIPWNFPLLMAAWKLGPALTTGNCVVRLHRIHRGRQADRARRRGEPEEGLPRARRQEPQHRLRRRRPGGGRSRRERDLLQPRAMLRGGVAPVHAAEPVR